MFNDTFLDRDFFDQIYERMTALLDFCPEERFLVHGDYAYSNVLVHEGRITGELGRDELSEEAIMQLATGNVKAA